MLNDQRGKANNKLTDQNKTIALFQFIRELNTLRQKPILNTEDYPFCLKIQDLPYNPEYLQIYFNDGADEVQHVESIEGNVLLSITKPSYEDCPEPDKIFKDWLVNGWNDFRREPSVRDTLNQKNAQEIMTFDMFKSGSNNVEESEHFKDNQNRVKSFESWRIKRGKWVERQEIIAQVIRIFSSLYNYYFELQRESETKEIIIANGVLTDKKNSDIYHPVLTRRVKLEYDAESNTITLVDTDASSELYSTIFQTLEDVNIDGVNSATELLQEQDYHPFDRTETPIFLKKLVRSLSSDCEFFEEENEEKISDARLVLTMDPCIIVRKRLDGTIKAIERIIEDVEENGNVPGPISDIVSGGTIDIPEDTGELSIEEQLASVGGESVDILLSKEANSEQLDIARRIENFNAVLVQGPPGTGKTHTIANLMGHFLAQGKTVLVTSHTKKALHVLKDKVSPGLQDLCVSMIDDSNVDMERAVDGITRQISKSNSRTLDHQRGLIALKRKECIEELASVRKKIFDVMHQECETIVLNGESISPSEAAKFVAEHETELSEIIPGDVKLRAPLPLGVEGLSKLYKSNESISDFDEKELENELPDPAIVMQPNEFAKIVDELKNVQEQLCNIQEKKSWSVSAIDEAVAISGEFGEIVIPSLTSDAMNNLRSYSKSFGELEDWKKAIIVDGKENGGHRQQWIQLTEEIENVKDCAEDYLACSIGKQLEITQELPENELKKILLELIEIFREKGKVGKLALLRNKNYSVALDGIKINGVQLNSAEGCRLAIRYLNLSEARKRCERIWNALLCQYGVANFSELDNAEPERIAKNWIAPILHYLDWYTNEYTELVELLDAAGIDVDKIFERNPLDSDEESMDKIFVCIKKTIPAICDVCTLINKERILAEEIDELKNLLTTGKHGGSAICRELTQAVDMQDQDAYASAYASLVKMYEKYETKGMRSEYLEKLRLYAPRWAESIEKRKGIHGEATPPNDIENAWKWKQLSGIIAEMTSEPFEELQERSLELSKAYREITAKYAEKCGWYYLLRRTEANINMKQALEGWRQTVKSIGKGTGKRAPKLRAKARKLMVQCQQAVPCWIMPINKALESLDPRENKFDIIIIDEASQADISSLAILYMGKKLIIVGDDKQVSPMAIGVEDRKIEALQQQFISDKIPNAHLYTAKMSIYDIAKTTFQPLMLREHFRCVPEIIGFSNWLSYDGNIKPLRDASDSKLLPAVVNYRVDGGERVGKTNPKEADAIVALLLSCFDQREYVGKSFGVISLLGDEQVKLIQQKIEKNLRPKDIIERNILCGNSANFQGDERDVIFLSLVDSNLPNSEAYHEGPLSKVEFGVDEAIRKRYNVAASRARDQLWVVDSLDPANDLKPGDIRRRLIEYSLNPNAIEIEHEMIEKRADSPFEVSVASALAVRGYNLVQQWKVGSYRLDIVAVCGSKKVAIECDGERWHSGEEKIREDMERQTILERLGWRFIRIRGSEYYRDSESTINRVVAEMSALGIEPEKAGNDRANENPRESELLNRVKAGAYEYIKMFEEFEKLERDSADTIINPLPKPTPKPNPPKPPQIPIKPPEPKPPKRPEETKKPQPTEPLVAPKPTPPPKSKSGFTEKLDGLGAAYIDNSKGSGIIWVIYDKEKKKQVEALISEYGYRSSLEKRGAVATDGKPAWRVMIGGK